MGNHIRVPYPQGLMTMVKCVKCGRRAGPMLEGESPDAFLARRDCKGAFGK